MSIQQPVYVAHLLPVLDTKLSELLRSLTPDEWQAQTVAKLWKVKDVAAHLLDSNIRILSILRDGYFGEQANIPSRQDLLDFLNGLNADWVKAMKRVSPSMLIFLLETTGKPFCDYLQQLPPSGPSLLSVEWAGETESKNWMEIAREYTEKWLHQQQIRDAVHKPGLMTRELFHPFIDIFMLALPHTFRNTPAETGTVVQLTISSDIGGSWHLLRIADKWVLSDPPSGTPATTITIDPDTAWKLFSKSLRPGDVHGKVGITGDPALGETALSMVSVMA
ncbi:maleylpyruvate isomerase family mycothiol-dependent enzyme [Chitinophaga sp. NPDC101104]|uniref:maleylpyruvate isomerase family mycothiol-dependent enzyme n=1 Tax=Chitinophaga sp. NPDC101104 TaxID=3390561 RepID=UPI003CFD09E4